MTLLARQAIRWLTLLFVALMLSPTRAEASPPDGVPRDIPELYAIRTPHFVFTFPPGAQRAIRPIAAQGEAIRTRLCQELGISCFQGPVRVHLATSLTAFRRAQPGASGREGSGREGHLDWAVGVAYTQLNYILLRSDRGALLDLRDTFIHETSHMALLGGRPGEGVSGAFLPRWFIEGVAIHQAGESVLGRIRAASAAALTGSLIPIRELRHRFPTAGPRLNLAYAESVLFFRWLLREIRPGGHVELIRRVVQGERFRDAFPKVFGDSPDALWRDWRKTMRSSASWIPILTGSGVLWSALTFLFLWVWWKKRKDTREMLARWDAGEPDDDGPWA